MSALEISGLHCNYNGREILNNLDIKVQHNEILCLLGPSGCGKTTLLKAVAGLMHLSQGRIDIVGRTVDQESSSVPPEKRKVGMIFQDYALFPHLTVLANVTFALENLPKAKALAKADDVLHLVNLHEFKDRYPHQLSGGQQQRVAIARALAYKPDLMLLDEPFSNIDTQVRLKLINEIRSILKSQQISAVFVTHSKEEAFAFADKLAIFNQGRIEQTGTPDELYHRPKSRFVADFLGGGNYLDAEVLDEQNVLTALGKVTATKPITKAVGSKLSLLIRPQQVQLREDDAGDAKVLEQQFLGASNKIIIEVEGIKLESRQTQGLNGTRRARLSIPPHELILF